MGTVSAIRDNPENNKYDYVIEGSSKFGCPVGRLSNGGYFLIFFFITLTLYCAVGIFLNHHKGDRSGMQLIPNYNFWSELPGLCKDGVKFLLNGCKSGYSTIE